MKPDSINLLLEFIFVFILGVLFVTLARADENTLLTRGDRTFSIVKYIDDVPRGACRYVQYPPRPVDVLTFPEPQLFCNTMDAIGRINEPIATRPATLVNRTDEP